MKKVILLIALTLTLHADYWTVSYVAKKGLSTSVECKNGYLIDKIYGVYNGHDICIEQSHCTSTNSWNGDCDHKPIPCEVKCDE